MSTPKQQAAFQRIALSYVLGILNRSGLKAAPIFIDNQIEFTHDKVKRKIEVYFESTKHVTIPIQVSQTSKTDLWAHVFSDSIWLCRLSDLRSFLFVEPKQKSDTHLSYDLTDILPAIFHRIDNLSIKDFLGKIQILCNEIS